jgi:hypothetical protein
MDTGVVLVVAVVALVIEYALIRAAVKDGIKSGTADVIDRAMDRLVDYGWSPPTMTAEALSIREARTTSGIRGPVEEAQSDDVV